MSRPDEIDELITVVNRIDFWVEKVGPGIKWNPDREKRMREQVIQRLQSIADKMDVELRRACEDVDIL